MSVTAAVASVPHITFGWSVTMVPSCGCRDGLRAAGGRRGSSAARIRRRTWCIDVRTPFSTRSRARNLPMPLHRETGSRRRPRGSARAPRRHRGSASGRAAPSRAGRADRVGHKSWSAAAPRCAGRARSRKAGVWRATSGASVSAWTYPILPSPKGCPFIRAVGDRPLTALGPDADPPRRTALSGPSSIEGGQDLRICWFGFEVHPDGLGVQMIRFLVQYFDTGRAIRLATITERNPKTPLDLV